MNGVKEAFDTIASQYDRQRKLVIPEFDAFYSAAVWAATWEGDTPAILDMGAGTGLLSEMLLKRYPAATLTLMDISSPMLDVAQHRFQGKERIRYLLRDYSKEDIGNGYDIICSALSIHHLEHPDKQALYRKIFHALNHGGIFVNAEQVEGETPWTHQQNLLYWDEYVKRGILDPEEQRAMFEWRNTLDKMAKLSVQLGWLREAGFVDVDMAYKNRSFAVFSGRRE